MVKHGSSCWAPCSDRSMDRLIDGVMCHPIRPSIPINPSIHPIIQSNPSTKTTAALTEPQSRSGRTSWSHCVCPGCLDVRPAVWDVNRAGVNGMRVSKGGKRLDGAVMITSHTEDTGNRRRPLCVCDGCEASLVVKHGPRPTAPVQERAAFN